ncbi:MAG: hypothetical protein IKN10_02840 [Muribaculaceae bacterium]|nr:hypothetical protein [Muribaculaceae bacterium]
MFTSIPWREGAPCPSCNSVTGHPKAWHSSSRSAVFSRCRYTGNSSKSSTGIPASRHSASSCGASSSSRHTSTLVPPGYVIS